MYLDPNAQKDTLGSLLLEISRVITARGGYSPCFLLLAPVLLQISFVGVPGWLSR